MTEVEVLRQEMLSNELVIEGEFLSTDEMVEKGMSESADSKLKSIQTKVIGTIKSLVDHLFNLLLRQRIEAIKKHCKTQPKKLMRPGH